jgi:hypothetical protein
MSVIVVPDVGKIPLLKLISGESVLYPFEVALFTNDPVISKMTTLAGLTEATFPGYARLALAGRATAAVINAAGRSVTTWNQITWTATGVSAEDAAGYYVANSAGILLWVEKFDAPIGMRVNAAFLKLTPKFSLESVFSNL